LKSSKLAGEDWFQTSDLNAVYFSRSFGSKIFRSGCRELQKLDARRILLTRQLNDKEKGGPAGQKKKE